MKQVDIIIFGGQSNMQGQSDRLSECEEVANAYEYKQLTDSFVPLKNPTGEDIRYDGGAGVTYGLPGVDADGWRRDHVLGAACYGHTNLLPAFCRAYLAKGDVSVIAIHAAKGATELAAWLPGSEGYAALLKKAKAGIEKAKTQYEIRRITFVWLQGESDALACRSAAYYRENLVLLGEALQKELGLQLFAVIRVGRFAGDARDEEIIAAQEEVCRTHPLFKMLTDCTERLNKTPASMNPHAPGHYSAAGYEELGNAAGHALAAYFLTEK